MSSNFDTWFHALGKVTRTTLIFSVSLTALSSFAIVSPRYFILSKEMFSSLQLWRPLTAAFYFGDFSLPWLMAMGMLVSYVKFNEENDFKNKTADFVWMLLLLISALSAVGLFFRLPIISFALMMALCWVFCKRNPSLQLSLFGFVFNANMFPWVLMLFHIILGQGIAEDIAGLAVGHLFVFLHDMLPVTHGIRILETPVSLKRMIPDGNRGFGVVHPEAYAPNLRAGRPQPAPAGRHQWGRGRVLGAN